MKNLIFLHILAGLFFSVIISCKKDVQPQTLTALTIVNALPGGDFLAANFNEQRPSAGLESTMWIKYRVYSPNNHVALPSKEQPILIYKIPDTNAKDKPVYQLSLNLGAKEASTLFLFGTLTQPEMLSVNQMPPYHSLTDSVAGLRLINLSPDKKPVRVHISGKGTDKTVSNLAYKQITDYITVNATSAVTDVLVEFYDQASGSLLTRYTLTDVGTITAEVNKWRYRNYTMVWLPNDAKGNLAADPFLVYDF